jgi:hypothetical protein
MFCRRRGQRPRSCKIGNLLSGIAAALGGDVTSGMSTKPGTMLLTGLYTSSSDTSAYDCRCPQPL